MKMQAIEDSFKGLEKINDKVEDVKKDIANN